MQLQCNVTAFASLAGILTGLRYHMLDMETEVLEGQPSVLSTGAYCRVQFVYLIVFFIIVTCARVMHA